MSFPEMIVSFGRGITELFNQEKGIQMLEPEAITSISIKDLPLLVCVICGYVIYRYFVVHKLLRSIGRMFHMKNLEKFSNRLFDLMHYAFSAGLGIKATHSRPYSTCIVWAMGSQGTFQQHSQAFDCTVLEKVYFLFFAAYYCVDIFYINTASDPIVIALHHMATLMMIFFSVELRVPELCFVIMVLHDVVDVPLYLGKICTYLNFKVAKDTSLLIFAAMCTWFRMINYPFVATYAVKNGFGELFSPKLYHFTSFLLWVLYGCHISWFLHIVRAVVEMIKGLPIRDNRSD